jgi:hypothetical protein
VCITAKQRLTFLITQSLRQLKYYIRRHEGFCSRGGHCITITTAAKRKERNRLTKGSVMMGQTWTFALCLCTKGVGLWYALLNKRTSPCVMFRHVWFRKQNTGAIHRLSCNNVCVLASNMAGRKEPAPGMSLLAFSRTGRITSLRRSQKKTWRRFPVGKNGAWRQSRTEEGPCLIPVPSPSHSQRISNHVNSGKGKIFSLFS